MPGTGLTGLHDPAQALAWLWGPAGVRERCHALHALAAAGRLSHFAVDPDRLDAAARYVADTIRARHPTLDVPLHSRWRHVAAGGVDRWAVLRARLAGSVVPDEVARVRIDLAVTSVLLDAGAGERWTYREPGTGVRYTRSEGLAVASVHLFASGTLSASPGAPLRVDAAGLQRVDEATLAAAFQVCETNPLPGLAARAGLLRRLGAALEAQPALFGATAPRVGNLVDHWRGQAPDGGLAAADLLGTLLRAFADVWPPRLHLGGTNLGDVGWHPAVRTGDLTDSLVPLHKLSQWLAYSLVDPLADAGIAVTGLDALTGLAEYRNGGLFVDLGVLRPKHRAVVEDVHAPDSEVVVEWRALTVALLDILAPRVQAVLGVDAAALPLGRLLEGGTWHAGRRVAFERRADGAPPIRVAREGTVF